MRTQIVYLLAFLTTLAIPAARATSFIELPFPTSVQEAPVIVHGVIGSKRTDWAMGGDGTRRIYTYYDLRVEEVVKGSAQEGAIVIREMGGQKDGVGMQVSGTAEFSTGEDAVIFLGDRNPDGSHDVWGMMMGKYVLEKDSEGERLVGPGITGGGDGDEPEHVPAENAGHSAPTRKRWTMDSLRQLVREQAAASPVPVNPPAPANASAQKTPEPLGKIVPTASVAPRAAPAAPELQPSEGGRGALTGLFFLLALGGLGTFVILRRR